MPLRDAPAPCCECSLCILPDLQRRSCRVLHGSASPLPAFSNHAMHALPPFRLSLMPPSPPRSPHRAPSYPSNHFNLPHASIQVTCSPSSHGPDKHVGQTKTIAMVGSVSVPRPRFIYPYSSLGLPGNPERGDHQRCAEPKLASKHVEAAARLGAPCRVGEDGCR
jgi:hypothetical protein